MKCIGLWWGGNSYSAPDGHNPRDLEHFDSINDAKRTFEARANHPGFPCVDEDLAEMHVYFGGEYHENGPDRIICFGKRGGTLVNRA